MDNNFQVTTQLLTDKAKTIDSINGEFKDTMGQIKKLIHNLDNEWKSDAAREFVEKFDTLDKEFINYYQVVDSYREFLNRAAEDYVTAETSIQNGIS